LDGSLVVSVSGLSAPLEALAAIDRPVVLGNEGDLCGCAALGTDSIIHFASRAPVAAAAAITLAFTGITARLATNGFVGEALLGIEFLFTGGKNEIFTAVPAS
jgi:hypothetical protein